MVFNKEKARASMSTQLSSIKLDTRTMEIYKNVKQCTFLTNFFWFGKILFFKNIFIMQESLLVLNKISYVQVFKLFNLISEILN